MDGRVLDFRAFSKECFSEAVRGGLGRADLVVGVFLALTVPAAIWWPWWAEKLSWIPTVVFFVVLVAMIAIGCVRAAFNRFDAADSDRRQLRALLDNRGRMQEQADLLSEFVVRATDVLDQSVFNEVDYDRRLAKWGEVEAQITAEMKSNFPTSEVNQFSTVARFRETAGARWNQRNAELHEHIAYKIGKLRTMTGRYQNYANQVVVPTPSGGTGGNR